MQTTKQQWGRVCVSVLAAITLGGQCGAIDLGPGEPCAAFKMGRIGRTTMEITDIVNGDREAGLEPTWTIGVSFDYPLTQHLYAGAVVDWHWLGEPYPLPVDLRVGGVSALELGVQLKWLISLGDGRFAIRPGIGIGGAQGHYTLLAFRAGIEFQMSVSERFGIGIESGVWHSPVGTDSVTDVAIGPMGYLRGEVLFSVWGRRR
ncbi:MAG: hypothetical protein AB1772_09615 [Candidatus Zixiibacteriota bacterium]